ncbi:type II toxin-antitoxin system HipA family toxin [Okibacterium fritillariae]|uniref:type II toxin-antitoxin system HipA family toxin n=1 Tax=Okibacterium fritillariae TaxID=123320 RepID=UPI0040557CE4
MDGDKQGLVVRLYGTRIGTLGVDEAGAVRLAWTDDASERWRLRDTPLSMSLPVGADAADAAPFFGGLLPEGLWLERLAAEVHVASNNVVGMLAEVGADLAGALSVGRARDPEEPRRLDADELDAILSRASGFLLGGGGSALPGFQRKVTLTRREGAWFAGRGSIPSTHILKPVDAESVALADGENFVLGIARSMGLLAYESWVETIGARTVLVIERYDRRAVPGGTERIHQEDFAQALALPWGGDDKFERQNPGANMRAIAAILDRDRTIFSTSEPDRETLLRYTVLNVASGNTDAHMKNFSLMHHEDGSAALAPFYDASPLALAYEAPQGMAMSIAGESQIGAITRDHLIDEAQSWGVRPARAREVIDESLEQIIDATRRVVAPASIEKHVPGYIRGQAQNLLDGQPARLRTSLPYMLMPRL